MERSASIISALVCGLLLVFGWPDSPLTFLIFFAWVPLFFIAEKETKTTRFLLFAFIALLIWNAGTTWWIWNSTAPGAVGAIVANSLLMCLPLYGFHKFKLKYGNRSGYIALIAFWLSFEYIHLNWQLSWPWLTLGNVFAKRTNMVQWYEYTGVSGGSLWVLLVNILLYSLVISHRKSNRNRAALSVFLVLVLPVSLSYLISWNNDKTHPEYYTANASQNVVIVQPNIDPYTEKFDVASTEGQIQKLINLSEPHIDAKTRLVLWPETALPVGVWQDKITEQAYYKPVFEFVNRHPGLTLQTGIETFKNYGSEKATKTARRNEAEGIYYDVYNSAIVIKAGEPFQIYNKSKLVPGVETLPDFLLWMSAIFEKFGGTAGGYGIDKEATAFAVKGNPYATAPIICYESIYGEYVTKYVQKGANLLTVMTNDGWWANTPGHRQHLQYARLRAIETRKWIARSANTGISAVINSRGDIVDSRPWDTPAAIKYSIPPINAQTFYVRNGAVIFGLALFMTFVLLGYHFVMLLRKRFITRH